MKPYLVNATIEVLAEDGHRAMAAVRDHLAVMHRATGEATTMLARADQQVELQDHDDGDH